MSFILSGLNIVDYIFVVLSLYIELLCEAAGLGMRPVPDPYYGDDEGFQNVFDLVKTACHRIAEQWKGNHE